MQFLFPAKPTGIAVCCGKLCPGVLLVQCLSIPGCCVPGGRCRAREQVSLLRAVWLCLLQRPRSASVGSACAVLCRLEYSACPAVGMGAVSRGAGTWWDNALCRCRESASRWSCQAARAPGRYRSCQSHLRAEPWPRTRVTRFSSLQRRALLVFDKEKRVAPIFRKPGSQCGIYSVDTNIVLELK